ncbi:MAG: LLM class F420-dependent oxidoreductase [Candidatus Binatia bacterium]
MQFGVHFSLGVGFTPTADDYARVVQKIEELGYHSAWIADHIVIPEKIEASYPWTADGSPGFPLRAPFPDVFALLGFLAAKTQKILLGTSVLVVPQRNPIEVAKAVATVDLLSGGRFLFGVGVGWLKDEFDVLGEHFSERGARTHEYIKIMKALWQGGPVGFEGKFFQFPPVHAVPTPVQKPHPPIIFGGESLAAMKRVAELGDGWQPGAMPLETLREKLTQLKTLMAERGRDYSRLSLATFGSPAVVKQQPESVTQLSTLGISQMVLGFMGKNAQDTIAQLEDFARTVMK